MSKRKLNHQWDRVFGPDLDQWNEPLRLLNKAVIENKNFINACIAVGIEVTKRQASKWSNKKGAAYKHYIGIRKVA